VWARNKSRNASLAFVVLAIWILLDQNRESPLSPHSARLPMAHFQSSYSLRLSRIFKCG
jgi:hypothetical protein